MDSKRNCFAATPDPAESQNPLLALMSIMFQLNTLIKYQQRLLRRLHSASTSPIPISPYLSGWFDAADHAEVDDEPGDQQREHESDVDGTGLVDVGRARKHVVPDEKVPARVYHLVWVTKDVQTPQLFWRLISLPGVFLFTQAFISRSCGKFLFDFLLLLCLTNLILVKTTTYFLQKCFIFVLRRSMLLRRT